MDGRNFDLEELSEMMRNAKSRAEHERYEKIMWRILGESQPIRALRRQLIAATRAKDIRAVKRIQQHIMHVRLSETNGHSWGQDKAERKFI